MNRFLLFTAIIIVGFVFGYAIEKNLSREASRTVTSGITIISGEEKDSGEDYEIDASYPVFGVTAFDEHIKAIIDDAIAEIRALQRSDASLPKNTLATTYSDPYVGEDYLSVKLIVGEYTGGAHPLTTILGVNYDRAKNAIVSLDDVLPLIGMDLAGLSQTATEDLRKKLGDAFQSMGASADPDNFSSFAIGTSSVTFIFQPYQVAAYAAGPQEVTIQRVQ